MRKSIAHRMAVGLALAALAAWTAPRLHATPSAPRPALACSVALDGALRISADPITVQVKYDQVIGDPVSAEVEDASGLTVAGVRTAGRQAVALTFNTSRASPGDWMLTLVGSAGECSGKVTVAN